MRFADRHALAAALVLLVAILGAGCGDDSTDTGGAGRSTTAEAPASGTPTDPATASTTDADEDADDEVDPEADEDAAPTPADRAAGRGLDRLAKAFEPVSDRINFLVAAETLRADAVDANAGEAIERERSGVVLIEAERMTDVLADARPRVAAVPVRTVAQQQVQQLLLGAIDIRSRAMGELTLAIKAQRTEQGDSVVKERFATWRASWDESLRATREAMTTTQDARAELGLVPAREEALR